MPDCYYILVYVTKVPLANLRSVKDDNFQPDSLFIQFLNEWFIKHIKKDLYAKLLWVSYYIG
jgi:hypothetical protein